MLISPANIMLEFSFVSVDIIGVKASINRSKSAFVGLGGRYILQMVSFVRP